MRLAVEVDLGHVGDVIGYLKGAIVVGALVIFTACGAEDQVHPAESTTVDASTTQAPASSEASGTDSSTTTSVTPSTGPTDDVVAGPPLRPNIGSAARTDGDGTTVLLYVVGGPKFDPDDPCTVRYLPTISETDTAVAVDITAESPRGTANCDSIGISRTIEVHLSHPLGQRSFSLLGEPLNVFDGSSLYTPGWLPEGWTFRTEGPGHFQPEQARYWTRQWSLPDDGMCPTPEPLELTEGAADLIDGFPRETGEATVGEYDIKGATATYSTSPDSGVARLRWTIADHGFVLTALQVCLDTTPPSLDDMLQFARSLTPP